MRVGKTWVWMVIAGVMLLAAGSTYVPAQTASGQGPRAIIETKFGNMEIRFFPDKAPKHVENFVTLAKVWILRQDDLSPCHPWLYDSGGRSEYQRRERHVQIRHG